MIALVLSGIQWNVHAWAQNWQTDPDLMKLTGASRSSHF